jgi:putative phosphoesterase
MIGASVSDPSYLKIAGVIGDVHAEDELLEAALNYFASKSVDKVLCTGDIAGGSGSLAKCCALLQRHKARTVRGNHDRWFLSPTMRELSGGNLDGDILPEVKQYLDSLMPTLDFKTAHGAALLCHGLGKNDMAKVGAEDFGYAIDANQELQTLLKHKRYRFVINGHSHQAMVRHFPGLTVINAGSLQRSQNPGFSMLDFESKQVQMLRFSEARQVVVDKTVPLLENSL